MIAVVALAAVPLGAVTIDRVAARIDQQVLTVSEINQMAEIRFFPNRDPHEILDALIAQALRFRDVERFGAQDISKDSIETRLQEIQRRFASPAEFTAALQHAELTLDEVRALVKRELQVEAYIQERFAPMIFVSNEDIESMYSGTWSEQRRQRGLPIPPLTEVSEEIRTLIRSRQLQTEIDKWTAQLRARANVDVYAWR
jgi:phenylpropionate dioxygenase-like ring-hydroxylating dioxygenase large terminal subunit